MDTVANKPVLAALLSPNVAYEFLTRHWTHQTSVAQGDKSYPSSLFSFGFPRGSASLKCRQIRQKSAMSWLA